MSFGRNFQKEKRAIFKKLENIFLFFFPKFKKKIYFFKIKKEFKKILKKEKILLKNKNILDDINKYEYHITSQNNEDGIIDHIFSKINNKKKFVEVGFEFRQFNSLNLIRQGWQGVLVDADKKNCDDMQIIKTNFFGNSKIEIINKFVHKDNINEITKNENIDFFSIDIDGNDYWVLENLNMEKIKVVCAEYNPFFNTKLVTIPYSPDFVYKKDQYYGMSLTGLNKLLKNKNFFLVAVDSSGTNAFFVKNTYKNLFRELDPYKSIKKSIFFSKSEMIEIEKYLNKKKLVIL